MELNRIPTTEVNLHDKQENLLIFCNKTRQWADNAIWKLEEKTSHLRHSRPCFSVYFALIECTQRYEINPSDRYLALSFRKPICLAHPFNNTTTTSSIPRGKQGQSRKLLCVNHITEHLSTVTWASASQQR